MEVKRAAKAAIKDEAGYVKSVNRGRAAMSTLKYWTSAAVPVSVLATLATGGIAGAIIGAGAASANHYINKHANEQIAYTEESEYGHDLVVAMKKH